MTERSICASLTERRVTSSSLIKIVIGVVEVGPINAATGKFLLRRDDGEWSMTLCTTEIRPSWE